MSVHRQSNAVAHVLGRNYPISVQAAVYQLASDELHKLFKPGALDPAVMSALGAAAGDLSLVKTNRRAFPGLATHGPASFGSIASAAGPSRLI